ncbi:hypothetical protein NDU88_005681, partial [Pleurodeles waltl]
KQLSQFYDILRIQLGNELASWPVLVHQTLLGCWILSGRKSPGAFEPVKSGQPSDPGHMDALRSGWMPDSQVQLSVVS